MDKSLDTILNTWGIAGAFIVIFMVVIYVLWKVHRKDIKQLLKENSLERKEDRSIHLEELRRAKKENEELTRTYSKDSRELGIILKEFELLLKQKNRE